MQFDQPHIHRYVVVFQNSNVAETSQMDIVRSTIWPASVNDPKERRNPLSMKVYDRTDRRFMTDWEIWNHG